ncbi:MAG: hypothetical protein FJ303_23740 [Planctomycetes bacterium]|nr:hypothetical protein [Planctomycetota bacterium]
MQRRLSRAQGDLRDENVLVRVRAATEICEIDPSQNVVAIPVLEVAADGEGYVDGDKSIARNLAIIELGKHRSNAKSAIPILKKRLSGTPYERVIAAAALAQIDKSTYEIAFPILAAGLKEEQITRVTAARAICELGDDAKDLMPSVRKLLEDEDEFVRTEVARALKR